MRRSYLFALTGAVLLLAALALVFDSGPVETAEVVPAPVLPTEPPTTFAVVLAAEIPGGKELAEAEQALTEEAIATTTTTSPATTTTQVAAKKSSSGSSSGSGSSGSGGSGSTTTSTTQPETPPVTINAEFRSDYESDFRSRINSLRSANGLGGLSSNGSLNTRARDWAKSMADSNSLKHSNIGNLVPPWSGAGENVGKGGSVGSIFNSLAGSSGHLANMLGDYTDFGVGVWVDTNGTLWAVQVFTR
jgi:uncharacterized protein YkwD